MKKLKTRKRTTRQRTPLKNPVTTIRQKIRRFILISAACLFVVGLWYAYASTNDMFSSNVGRAATWSTGALLGPAVDDLPLWAWGGGIGLALYLWVRHKFIMSIVYGVIAGLILAIG